MSMPPSPGAGDPREYPYGAPVPPPAQPAPYGEQPAPYGEQHAPYGQSPPSHGEQPAPWGAPQAHGEQPAAHGHAVSGEQPPAYDPGPAQGAYGHEPAAGAYGHEPGPGAYGQEPAGPGEYGPYGQEAGQGPQQPPQGFPPPPPPPSPPPAQGTPPYSPYDQSAQIPYQAPYQAPYGEQPFGAPAAPPPSPAKRRGPLIAAIAGGVVAVGAVIGLVVALTGGDGGDGDDAFPKASFRLAPPKTLLDGQYTLDQDLSQNQGAKITDSAKGARDVRDAHAVVVTYAAAAKGQAGGSLVVSGLYGRIKNVDSSRDSMLKGAGAAEGAKIVTPPKDFGGESGQEVISCQTMTSTQGAVKLTFPMCAWADSNTGASVAEVTPAAVHQGAADVDLAAAAKRTRTIRAAMTHPR